MADISTWHTWLIVFECADTGSLVPAWGNQDKLAPTTVKGKRAKGWCFACAGVERTFLYTYIHTYIYIHIYLILHIYIWYMIYTFFSNKNTDVFHEIIAPWSPLKACAITWNYREARKPFLWGHGSHWLAESTVENIPWSSAIMIFQKIFHLIFPGSHMTNYEHSALLVDGN
jgi:hypothetical protein